MDHPEYQMDQEELEEDRIQRIKSEMESDAYKEYCYQVGRFVIEFEKLIYELKALLNYWSEKEPGWDKHSFAQSTGGEVLSIFKEMLEKECTVLDGFCKETVAKLYDRVKSLNDTRNTVVHSEHMESDDDDKMFLLNKVKVRKTESDYKISCTSTEDLLQLCIYMAQAAITVRRIKAGFGNSKSMSRPLEIYIPDLPPQLVFSMQKEMLKS